MASHTHITAPTRRAMFAAAIAGGAVLAATPRVADANAVRADGLLQVWAAQREQLFADGDEAFLAGHAAKRAATEEYPALPAAVIQRQDDPHGTMLGVGKPHIDATVENWRRSLRDTTSLWMSADALERYARRGRELVAAWDGHKATCAAIDDRHQVEQHYRRASDLYDQAEEIRQRIFETEVTTPAGALLKARMVLECVDDDMEVAAPLRALIADLERVAA